MPPPRQTKIVATLGPATDRPRVLDDLIRVGVDVVRLNFSHGSAEEHARRALRVRERAHALRRQVAVLGDLQGPKIRTGRLRQPPVRLVEGADFCLDAEMPLDAGDEHAVGITYRDLPRDLQRGDTLVLDDGRLVLEVVRIWGKQIHTRVRVGGLLANNKGINRQGGGLSAPALTVKDREDILLAGQIGVDYLAVSFPRSAGDLREARSLMSRAGFDAALMAKIERSEALPNLDAIMGACDAVMIARGDLGVEIGDAELLGVQKRILRRARELNCVVVTATQMMESMVESPIPTRAEVLDVANAVLDGTDAVMLSAETAVGHYPREAVEAMDRICRGAERYSQDTGHELSESAFSRIDESIAKAAIFTANHLGVRAIAALTETGSTAKWMSRIRSDLPVYALTPSEGTARRVNLYRGVYPVVVDWDESSQQSLVQSAAAALRRCDAVGAGDRVIVTFGADAGVSGGTDSMSILRIGEPGSEAREPVDNRVFGKYKRKARADRAS